MPAETNAPYPKGTGPLISIRPHGSTGNRPQASPSTPPRAGTARRRFEQTSFEHGHQLFVADKAPGRPAVEPRRSLSGETFHDQVGPQPAQDADEKFHIFVEGTEAVSFRMCLPVRLHGGIPEYLELVELDRRQGERIDGLRLGGHHPVGLARQPENEMRSDMYPACGRSPPQHGVRSRNRAPGSRHGAFRRNTTRCRTQRPRNRCGPAPRSNRVPHRPRSPDVSPPQHPPRGGWRAPRRTRPATAPAARMCLKRIGNRRGSVRPDDTGCGEIRYLLLSGGRRF